MTVYAQVLLADRMVGSGSPYLEVGQRDVTSLRSEGDMLVAVVAGATYHYRGGWSGRVLEETTTSGAVPTATPAQPAPAAIPGPKPLSGGPLRGGGGRR